jgi:hypothetical protein
VRLALVPAALLTAFTTHIATDIASAPLLRVPPLAIYLSTFVLASRSGWRSVGCCRRSSPP